MGKRRCQKKRKILGGEEDIISSLPDSILHEILSSIDTRSAVQTCILSNRWRYLWISLPSLDFDYFQFPGTDGCSDKSRRFAHFVKQVLSLRDTSNVSRFHLQSIYDLGPTLVKNCIRYASQHNAKELLLSGTTYPKPLRFPIIESLVSLEMDCEDISTPPDKPLRLPALKTLHLSSCMHGGATFVEETVRNSLNLETLILDELNVGSLHITAPNLRNLELVCLTLEDGGYYDPEILVSAPRLTSFKLKGCISPVFSSTSLPCLQNVNVDLVVPQFYYEQDEDIIMQSSPTQSDQHA